MPSFRKPTPQPFQLKPKHLVTAVLSVCAAAIVAVIVGVVGTFNSNGKTPVVETQPKEDAGAGRVEVLKPEGAGAVPEGGIVINPNAGGQHPSGIADNQLVPPAPVNDGGRAESGGGARQQPAARRNGSEAESGPDQSVPAGQQDKPDTWPAVTTQPVPPQIEQPAAETNRETPKPEQPEPKPEAEPKPVPAQAKPQSQQKEEVMDELF